MFGTDIAARGLSRKIRFACPNHLFRGSRRVCLETSHRSVLFSRLQTRSIPQRCCLIISQTPFQIGAPSKCRRPYCDSGATGSATLHDTTGSTVISMSRSDSEDDSRFTMTCFSVYDESRQWSPDHSKQVIGNSTNHAEPGSAKHVRG